MFTGGDKLINNKYEIVNNNIPNWLGKEGKKMIVKAV